MFSGEEMQKRLEDIRNEIEHAPDLEDVELVPELTNLAIFAGQADTVLNVAYRMVCILIHDIEKEIIKDNEEAEANRKWLEEWKAKEAAKSQDETEGKDDTEEAPDAE